LRDQATQARAQLPRQVEVSIVPKTVAACMTMTVARLYESDAVLHAKVETAGVQHDATQWCLSACNVVVAIERAFTLHPLAAFYVVRALG
jgi:hypothetical protein